MKVLNITIEGGEPNCKQIFPADAQIDTIAIKELLAYPEGVYDAIYCHNCLPVVENVDVIDTVKKMVSLLREDGELWLVTPSLEWCAQRILDAKPDRLAMLFLFGSDVHFRTGYTLRWLRNLIEASGIITRMATQEALEVFVNDQKTIVPVNTIVGIKHDIEKDKI
jgi:hypothetical protein